ncbi:hybrid sensor histidine kinase/response regulator [Novosphingobium sp. fls2-241-R2A-195]|jgi:two-component system CheB/CheR fusion protein|uniref:hybrid sensor histidine kinase/response regulator n=1 Tax=Novosphingobium sp. fls2-241-R2A-195 TaxID=3040296 RepID=UPI00254A4DAE|nr:hybrid sensor histidine kinase/response regulator [Novosphingobium sp. fls2-241-R2A-195]
MDANTIRTTTAYVSAMERLVGAVQDLSRARDVDAVTAVVREAARNLTGADGATFVLRDGDQCYYAEENAIAPLWKGRRFPMDICVSGWVMLNAQSIVIEDIYDDPRVPVEAYRPTFVKSLAMVPIRRSAPIGAIGNYWSSRHAPSAEEVAILQALADTTSVALENADLYGRLQGMVCTLQEQQARISEQHASLGVFTRALAHDLREPVRTLIAFSDLLRPEMEESGQEESRQAAYLRYIGESASRMQALIDSVGRYTRLDAPGVADHLLCSVPDVIGEVCQSLTRIIEDRKATIVYGLLPGLVADPVHLRQLFQNLIANAVLHNEPGVTVTIGECLVDEQPGFFVADDGVGIPEAQCEQIFQPFQRLVHRNDASGLGLAICRRIVTLYGGRIGCVSPHGAGATFHFTMPAAQQAGAPEMDDKNSDMDIAMSADVAPEVANVLIVDDREADLELTELALFRRPKLRCHVRSVRDGRAAQQILSTPGNGVDLILLDINMPDVDGFCLLENLRGEDTLRDVMVIMCSGSDHEPDQRRSAELGAAGYLLKPPRFASFRDIVAARPGLRLQDDADGLTLIRTGV